MNKDDEWEDFDWEDKWDEDFEERRWKSRRTPSGWKWRTVLSILSAFGWLIFLILWLFFFASDYGVYQNIAVFFVSVFVVFLINGVTWKSFDRSQKFRSSASIIFGLIWFAFLIYWLFFYAAEYSLVENIAFFILSLLVLGALNSVLWIPGRSGVSWRAAISAVSTIGWVGFLIVWFWMFRTDYTIYQNIAVFIISVLVLAAINAAVWVPYGLRKARKYV